MIQLAQGTPFADGIQYINSNFESAVSDISDMKVSLGTNGSYYGHPNQLSGAQFDYIFNIQSIYPSAQIGGIIPSYSIFVDSPALAVGTLDLSKVDTADLFPTGANMTAGKRAMVQFGNMLSWTDQYKSENPLTPYTINGTTYYLMPYQYSITIRNLDTATHSYLVVPNFNVLAAPGQSQFR